MSRVAVSFNRATVRATTGLSVVLVAVVIVVITVAVVANMCALVWLAWLALRHKPPAVPTAPAPA